MQWKIHNFEFCEQTQTLQEGEQNIKLESIASRVLAYFCQNQDRVVSRDELIECVWGGQVVTDNAVNRVIARLRKALKDDARSSNIIVTVPKQGYRFIAPASPINHGGPIPPQLPKISANYVGLSFVLVAVITALTAWFVYREGDTELFPKRLEALTRENGVELDLALSPDENWLVYSRFDDDVLNLYVKALENGIVQRISDGSGNAGGASWSEDGSALIYLYTAPDICQYRQKTFSDETFINDVVLFNCPLGSFGKARLSRDKNSLIFSQRTKGAESAYQLFKLDISSGEVLRLPQPEPVLAGHTEFDLHPFENKLLVSSPNYQQRLSFHVIDLDLMTYSTLFDKAGYICCAVWGHDGNSVVIMGPHPALQLERYDLSGNNMQIVMHSPLTLGPPQRVANGKDYFLSAGNYSINLFLDSDYGESSRISSSTMQETLPDVSPDETMLAYISDQSGQEQLWLFDMADNSTRQLSQFDDYQKYVDLKWSPAQKKIALLTMNSIKVVNATNGQSRLLKVSPQGIRGLSWSGKDSLAFSVETKEGWRVHHYELTTDTLRIGSKGRAFANFFGGDFPTIWFDDEGMAYSPDGLLPFDLPRPLGRDRKFAFQRYWDDLYVYRVNGRKGQIVKTHFEEHALQEVLAVDAFFGFSVTAKGIVTSQLETSEVDVYRTISN